MLGEASPLSFKVTYWGALQKLQEQVHEEGGVIYPVRPILGRAVRQEEPLHDAGIWLCHLLQCKKQKQNKQCDKYCFVFFCIQHSINLGQKCNWYNKPLENRVSWAFFFFFFFFFLGGGGVFGFHFLYKTYELFIFMSQINHEITNITKL